jgi:hypothetical protein
MFWYNNHPLAQHWMGICPRIKILPWEIYLLCCYSTC